MKESYEGKINSGNKSFKIFFKKLFNDLLRPVQGQALWPGLDYRWLRPKMTFFFLSRKPCLFSFSGDPHPPTLFAHILIIL